MENVIFIQKVKEDKKEEYVKFHKNCWPELLKAIEESGIKRQIIWLYGENIIIYMMAENFDHSISELSKKKVFKDWDAIMNLLLDEKQDYFGKGKITKLNQIFNFEEQLYRK